jgi:mRNA interferase YafQ
MVKSGHDMEHLKKIVRMLAGSEPLPPKNRDHALTGNWNGYRECHIEPDWLLVYKYFDDKLILSLTRTGSHSYLDMD